MTKTSKLIPARIEPRFCVVNSAGSVVHVFGLDREASAISCAKRKGLRVEKRDVEIAPAYVEKPLTDCGPSSSRFTRMSDHAADIAAIRGEDDCTEAGL